MSEVQKFILKDGSEEYEVYLADTDLTEVPIEDGDYRDITMPVVDMERVHHAIKGYASYAIGAFRNFKVAEVEKITVKFNLKIAGKAGIPMLTEGSAEGNFEIQVECKLPRQEG